MSEGSTKDIEKAHNNHTTQTLEYGGEQQRPRRRKMANPAPIGLFAFAGTTFLLSMYNVHTRGVQVPNVVLGMAIFGGGLAQLLAGMWEIPNGNTYGATVFSSYGSFWMSYATIFIPASGIMDSFGGNTDEFNQALGMYLMVWFMVTFMFLLPMLRRNLAMSILLTVLSLTLLLLSIGTWTGNAGVNKAGGVFGIIVGLIAWYIGVSLMMASESTAIFNLPLGVRGDD